MAIPFQIQIGRISRFLSKWASTKGPSPQMVLGSEIVPTILMYSGIEDRYLQSWDRFGIALSAAASVGNNSALRLRNPSGSNAVVIIEKLNFQPGIADTIFLDDSAGADLSGVVPGSRLDPRGKQNSVLSVSQGNNVASVNLIGQAQCLATVSYEWIVDTDQEIPILPGRAVTLTTTGLNESLRMGVTWRERALEESERA